jgi:predicted O-methyltransferase YrrM
MELIKPEYDLKTNEKQRHLDEIHSIIVKSGVPLEGNCFYHHHTLHLYPELYSKQLNLIWCGKQATTRICEIGFNAGHSTLLMLLCRENTPLEFTIFDIGMHSYTRPCLEYIQTQFPHVNFEYVEGDSTITIRKWLDTHNDSIGKYDVVHVDGGHSMHCIHNDMLNADKLVRVGGIIIIDDTNVFYINDYVDSYLSQGYTEVKLLDSIGYKHRIIRKTM